MPQAVQITDTHLRALAGHSYARGEAYWRDGRVRSCVIGEDSIDGVVAGSAIYHVRVSAQAGALVSDCTCPVQYEICKHAVALVLSYLELTSRAAHVPVATKLVDVFADRAELEAFVSEHQVAHVLTLAAEVIAPELALLPQDFWIKAMLARLALRDIGSLEAAGRHARARGVDQAIARAAYHAIHAAAADVRTALIEEADRPASLPDPALASLWSRLVQLRARLRTHASPRSRATRASATWAFDPHAAMITWKERERVVRSRDYGTFPLVTRLTMPGGGTPQLECSCEVREGACTHAIALVDATLDVLADPARASEACTVADELLRPAWARALAELDRMEARAVEPRIAIEVWWHVEHELGTPSLTPTVKKMTKRGGMSAGQRMTPARLLDDHGANLAEQDRRIAEDLATWIPAKNTGTYPARAFLALVGHPRVTSDHDDEPIEVVRAELGFQALAADDQIRLEPAVAGVRFSPRLLGALLQTHPPGEPLFVPEPERQRCLLLEVTGDARQLWKVLDRHGDAFPPESHAALLERLARMEGRLPVSVPHALKGREHAAEITVVVRLRLLPDVTLELELFVRPGPGAPLYSPGTGPRDVMIVRGGERGYVRRDLGSELAHARGLFARLPIEDVEEGPPQCFRIGGPEMKRASEGLRAGPEMKRASEGLRAGPEMKRASEGLRAGPDAALQLVEALQSPPDGLEVEWVDHPVSVGGLLAPDALRVHVEKKRDWFGLTGEIKLESGRLELAVLLDAARRQQRYVRVDERRWVELSDTLRQRLQAVADQTFRARDHLELSPGAAPAMRALAEAGAQVQAAEPWRELTERLASSRALRPRPPATLVATLRDYQTEGHAWLTRLAAWGTGACLADDMGLGKTIQAIAVLLDRAKLGPALVLAPTSVAINWVRELARFAPSLNPILYTEQAERTMSLAKLKKQDVLIASYGLLVRDAAELAATRFATLVIDEAQALKNPTTQRARAARNLDAAFRIALTGTPLENHLGELWSLFATVFPGMLGSWEQFRERYAVPIEKGRDPDARAALSRVIRPFLLRRTKQEVARELPSRTEIEVPVAMSDEEQALYDDARLAAVAELTAKGAGMRDQQRRFQVLAALTRLRLLASHPRLYDATSTVPSSKLRRAVELLEELRSEGHRALVFSQFTSHLALVRSALANAGFKALYLDGATPARQRAKLVDSFQAGEADVFLISLKAGGTGINLTAADYVLHLDPWWNPAVEDQATDRAHRIGQTRPVTVYRLITRGTIEEQIVALHRDKRALVAGILEGTDVAARLSARDLMSLLQTP